VDDDAYPFGWDVAWLARDRENRIGAFITAGCGPVVGAVDPTVEDRLLQSAPVTSSAELLTNVPDPSSFIDLATRGLYVFDWDYYSTYVLVARPAPPIASLPSGLEMPPISDVSFASGSPLRVVAQSLVTAEDVGRERFSRRLQRLLSGRRRPVSPDP